MNKEALKLISMSDVQAEEVKWLWYPYIPRGKITIVQGDPGEGKTTLVLVLVSLLTRGEPLPECEVALEPMNVIYQTAEDGLADTIKPRLTAAGRGLFPCAGHRRKPQGADLMRRASGAGYPKNGGGAGCLRPAASVSR